MDYAFTVIKQISIQVSLADWKVSRSVCSAQFYQSNALR